MICLGWLTAAAADRTIDRFISILALFLICTNEMTASVCRCALCVQCSLSSMVHMYEPIKILFTVLLLFFLSLFCRFHSLCLYFLLSLLLLVSFNNKNWTFLLSETMSKIANKSNTINWNIKETVIQWIASALFLNWALRNLEFTCTDKL